MNYELAKELKDAGFPQPTRGSFYLWIPQRKTPTGHVPPYWKLLFSHDTKTWKNEYLFVPTLSELIEACAYIELAGMRLHTALSLEQVSPTDWRVATERTDYIHGKTPEIAVVNLWLALQKTSD